MRGIVARRADDLGGQPNPPTWFDWTESFTEELSNAGTGNQDAATIIATVAERLGIKITVIDL